jgi:5-methylcytosine-specific restriction endonuclease McrA
MNVLLLNGDWQPIRVISTKRAIVLVLTEKAEVLAEGSAEFRSATRTVKVPEVIRLKRFVQIPFRAKIPLSNTSVLKRDHYKCAYCGHKANTVDHIIPKSRGGRHQWENVVAACRPCNAKKADKLLSELRWSLSVTPKIPTGTMWLFIGVREIPEQWTMFLGEIAVAS